MLFDLIPWAIIVVMGFVLWFGGNRVIRSAKNNPPT